MEEHHRLISSSYNDQERQVNSIAQKQLTKKKFFFQWHKHAFVLITKQPVFLKPHKHVLQQGAGHRQRSPSHRVPWAPSPTGWGLIKEAFSSAAISKAEERTYFFYEGKQSVKTKITQRGNRPQWISKLSLFSGMACFHERKMVIDYNWGQIFIEFMWGWNHNKWDLNHGKNASFG